MENVFTRNIVSIITVILMLFSVSACGSTPSSEGSSSSSSTSSNTSGSSSAQVNSNLKEIKIGTINSQTGANKDGGGLDSYYGQKAAIEMINKKGGVLGKYKIVPIEADDKSNIEEGKNATTKLIQQDKVNLISGVYQSAIAVEVAKIAEQNKVIFWDHVATSDAVLENNHYKYVFRPQVMGSSWGKYSVDFINGNLKLLGVNSPSELKVAILNENSPYGKSCVAGDMSRIKKYGMNVVSEQSYDRTKIADFKTQIDELIAKKPDVIFQTAYKADLTLFLKQAKEAGLKVKAIVNQGAGGSYYGSISKDLNATDVTEYLFNGDCPIIQLIPKEKLQDEVYSANLDALKLAKEKYNIASPSSYYGAAFSSNWILFEKVLPLAIEKYGDVTPDTVKKAALEIDIPERGTPAGYGVKFAPPEDSLAGQNTMAYPHIVQWYKNEWHIVWPLSFKVADPILPLPSESAFAIK